MKSTHAIYLEVVSLLHGDAAEPLPGIAAEDGSGNAATSPPFHMTEPLTLDPEEFSCLLVC